MTKKLYPHFNPEVHKIESKIATVRTSHHCKYNINYRIIWIPKYRKPILVGKVREVLKTIIDGQCQELSLNNPDLKYLGYKQHFGKGFDALWARGYYKWEKVYLSMTFIVALVT